MCKRILKLLVVALALPMAAFADSSINFVIPNNLNLSFSSTLLGELDSSGNLLDTSNVGAINITADITSSNDVLNQSTSYFGPGTVTVTDNVNDGTLFSSLFAAGVWFDAGSFSSSQNEYILIFSLSDGQGIGFLAAIDPNQCGDGGKAVVPEPGTLALFGTGLVGLSGAVRRKLKRA
jgi:PEP-CTERM motif-containing protein